MCAWFRNDCVIFSLLFCISHLSTIWHSTIARGGRVVGQYDALISFKYDVSLKLAIRKPEIPGNVIASFSIINHAITCTRKSLNYSSFIMNITAKFHFLSVKTDKFTWKTKKWKFHKSGKNRQKNVDVIKCHGTIFDLIFFPIMECWCDEPLWRGQLKHFKGDFRTLTMRWFWKDPFTIQNFRKMSLPVSP